VTSNLSFEAAIPPGTGITTGEMRGKSSSPASKEATTMPSGFASFIATTGGAKNIVSGVKFNQQNSYAIIFDTAVGTDGDGIDLEIQNQINRSDDVTKNGVGTVALTANNNRIVEGNAITINDGTLALTGAGQIDTYSVVNNSFTDGDWAGSVVLNNVGIFKHNSSSAQVLSGVVSGTGGLEKANGTGTLIITGNNSAATGDVTIGSSGILGGGGTIGGNTATPRPLEPLLNRLSGKPDLHRRIINGHLGPHLKLRCRSRNQLRPVCDRW